MSKKNLSSTIAIILILGGEFFFLLGQHLSCWPLYLLSIAACVSVILLAIYKKLDPSVKTMVLKKLLANAIAPKRINAFYLLFFIIHLTWISDAMLNLFLAKSYPEWPEIAYTLGVSILGLYLLILFFPTETIEKSKDKVVYVSGISTPAKPKDGKFESLNLLPLVRFLCSKDPELSRPQNGCTLLLLRTNQLDIKITPSCWSNIMDLWVFLNTTGSICIDQENENKIKDLFNAINTDIQQINVIEKEIKNLEKGNDEGLVNVKKEDLKNKIQLLIAHGGSQDKLDKILTLIIRNLIGKELAKTTGEDVKDSSNLEIVFTNGCDYNNFNSCQVELKNSLKKYDDNNYTMIFYVTPGTSIVGALMMLFSVDPAYKACFYAQDGTKEIRKIDKDYAVLNKIFKDVLAKTEENENS